MPTTGASAIICLMIAGVASINAILYLESWYGFACVCLAVAFGVAGALLWRESTL